MSATLMNPASLTALSLEDVTQLLYREARYLDGRDWDRWLGLYHPEVEFWMPAWDDDDKITEDPQSQISLILVGEGLVLTASTNGYGQLTPLDDFPAHGRGGQGVIALPPPERNGEVVAALQVSLEHELMLISSNGTLVRTPVSDVSIVGRNTQGVRLIRLDEGDRLTGVERVESLGD